MDPLADPLNLLVIDNEMSLRRTLRTALKSMGRRVAEAHGVTSGLAAKEQS